MNDTWWVKQGQLDEHQKKVFTLPLAWVIHEGWQSPCMIADQHERSAKFVQRTDLEPPG
jgi:hypothetical protein